MLIEYLSQHAEKMYRRTHARIGQARDELDRQQQIRAAAEARRQELREAKPLWRRMLIIPTAGERQARRVRDGAARAVDEAAGTVRDLRNRVEAQEAGLRGEEDFVKALASALPDSWTALCGFRNRAGETDVALVGPLGVWVIEVKRRAIVVVIDGEHWRFEKYDKYGNLKETGDAVDRRGRSWARQATDVADVLGEWLEENGLQTPIRTAVMLMHPRAGIGKHRKMTVDVVSSDPDFLLQEIGAGRQELGPDARRRIVALIKRQHTDHRNRRRRR